MVWPVTITFGVKRLFICPFDFDRLWSIRREIKIPVWPVALRNSRRPHPPMFSSQLSQYGVAIRVDFRDFNWVSVWGRLKYNMV